MLLPYISVCRSIHIVLSMHIPFVICTAESREHICQCELYHDSIDSNIKHWQLCLLIIHVCYHAAEMPKRKLSRLSRKQHYNIITATEVNSSCYKRSGCGWADLARTVMIYSSCRANIGQTERTIIGQWMPLQWCHMAFVGISNHWQIHCWYHNLRRLTRKRMSKLTLGFPWQMYIDTESVSVSRCLHECDRSINSIFWPDWQIIFGPTCAHFLWGPCN